MELSLPGYRGNRTRRTKMKHRKKIKKQKFDTSEYFWEIRIVGSEFDEEPPVMYYKWHLYGRGRAIAHSAHSYMNSRGAKRSAKTFLNTILLHGCVGDIPINLVNI